MLPFLRYFGAVGCLLKFDDQESLNHTNDSDESNASAAEPTPESSGSR